MNLIILVIAILITLSLHNAFAEKQSAKHSDLVWIYDAFDCKKDFSKCAKGYDHATNSHIFKTEKQIKNEISLELFKNGIVVVKTKTWHGYFDCREGCIPTGFFGFLISKSQLCTAMDLGHSYSASRFFKADCSNY